MKSPPATDKPDVLPVLLIEDDTPVTACVRSILERSGYPVVCIDSSWNIARLLDSAQVSGIVSSARRRDGVDASGFYTWLSQHRPELTRRIVFIASSLTDKCFAKLRETGIAFIRKPIRAPHFLSVVRKTIGKPPMTERILVVDDEEAFRDIVSMMLGFGGYRCCAVAGGRQALKLFDSGEKFDLVTTDIMNSPLGGIAFLEQIKSKFPDIPVLMVTGAHDISVLLACVRNGAYDWLLKPFEREQLLAVVRRTLDHRRLKQENLAYQAELAKLAKKNSNASRNGDCC